MRPALPATVVITQARHPLEGRDLRVLGWMRRLGRLELMLELPDGSKRLIPAEQTSQHDDPDPDLGPGGTGTLGRTADLLGLSVLVSALWARSGGGREQAARNPLLITAGCVVLWLNRYYGRLRRPPGQRSTSRGHRS